VLGELRHIATVGDDKVWPQLVEFLPDRGVQPRFVQRRHRERLAGEERLQRAPLYLRRADRNGGYALCAFAQALDVGEVPRAVAEAEHIDLMAGREMAYLVEGRDLVPAIRRERHAPAYKEDAQVLRLDPQLDCFGGAAEQISHLEFPDPGPIIKREREDPGCLDAACEHVS